MKKVLMLFAFLMFLSMQMFAQSTVTGTVTGAEDGLGLPGVSVAVKGTSLGTVTDINGKYSLDVPAEAKTLVFSFMGFKTQEVGITGDVINASLESSDIAIDDVVVTALGVTREKKSLGYSVQRVGGDDLAKTKDANLVNSLQGKVAGVQITSASGAVGAGSRIVIRGNSSFGNNQPLFVVDGTPISNASSKVSQWGGSDFGNAAMDVDPSNIESITVLKGANAAALYGSRGVNGVILITTKQAANNKKELGISYTGGVSFDNVAILPTYQNKYGQGGETTGAEYWFDYYKANGDIPANMSYQEYAQTKSFSYYDGIGGGVNDYYDESWGPRLDIGLMLPQFDSPYTLDANGNPVYTATPWVSQPDNVSSFFETGITFDHNVTLTANTDKASARFSYSNMSVKGTIPNTDLNKNSINLNSTIKLTDKLSATINLTYVNNKSDNLPGGGYDPNNVMQSLGQWFGRQVNMQSLKDNWEETDAFGKPYTWSYYYHNNPYWTVNRNTTSRTRDRMFGNMNLKYVLTDWMNVSGRFGTDFYTETRKHVTYNGSNESKTQGGNFWENNRSNREINADLFVNFDKTIGDIRLDGLIGANYRSQKYQFRSLTAKELTVPDFFTISNVSGNPTATMYLSELETNSVYAQANISYKDWLFLGATVRNDWSSTLPSDNWSYLYPSANLGFILSDALGLQSDIVSFVKLRASIAQLGNDTRPYQLYNVFSSDDDTFNGTTQYYVNRIKPNADLRPELSTAFELGADLSFFLNRLSIDFTYYNRNTVDQIMAVDIAPSTGYTGMYINAGEISNTGIELMVNGDILKSSNGLQWSMNVNFSKNENEVISLFNEKDPVQISTSWGEVSIEAQPGREFGIIKAYDFVRNDNGDIIVDGGFPSRTDAPVEVGTINPDFIYGIRNTFSYKDFNLGILIDGRKGGDIFSETKMFGMNAGILDETAEGTIREDGVVLGQNFMPDQTFVEKSDGSVNSTVISPEDAMYGLSSYIKGNCVIDGSFLKLREITLGYDLPKSLVQKTGFLKAVSINVYARNLALLWVHESNDIVIDPETGFGTNNGGMGIEQVQLPTSRTIGFKVNLQF